MLEPLCSVCLRVVCVSSVTNAAYQTRAQASDACAVSQSYRNHKPACLDDVTSQVCYIAGAQWEQYCAWPESLPNANCYCVCKLQHRMFEPNMARSMFELDRSVVATTQALTDALLSGHLGGAGLDVHWVVSHCTAQHPSQAAALSNVAGTCCYGVMHNHAVLHCTTTASVCQQSNELQYGTLS